MLFALLTVVLWSGAGYASARCARNWGSGRANRYRLSLAAVVLVAVCVARDAIPLVTPIWWYLLGGVLHLGLGDLALFGCYRLIGPRLGVLVVATLAVPMALVSEWLILGTMPPWPALLLVVGIIAGVLIAFAPTERLRLGNRSVRLGNRSVRLGNRSVRLGLVLGVLGAVGQGGAQVASRIGSAAMGRIDLQIDAFTGSLCRSVGGLAVLLLVWALVGVAGHRGDVAASYGDSTERLGGQAGRRVWPWLVLPLPPGRSSASAR